MDNTEFMAPFMKEGEALYKKYGNSIVDTDRIKNLEARYKILKSWLSYVIAAAEEIQNDKDLCVLCWAAYALVLKKEVYKANKKELGFPYAGTLKGDFAPLFPVFYFAENIIDSMEKRGLPEDIIAATLSEFGDKITDFYEREHRPGFGAYIGWMSNFAYCDIIRVDRFNIEFTKLNHPVRAYKKGDDIKIFADGAHCHEGGMLYGSKNMKDEERSFIGEIIEENGTVTGYMADSDGLIKKEKCTICGYTELIRKGDKALSVHIPANMPLNLEICESSLKRAAEIVKKYYPEYKAKAFCCISWMMSNLTKKVNGRETNVSRFADMFTRFPIESEGDGVYSFVFKTPYDTPIDELPENSSLQRNIKGFLKDGKVFYEMGGVREID